MTIPVSTAQLLGTFLETLGFGIYLVVGPQAFLVVRRKRLSKGFTIYLYSTMIITSALIVIHFITDIVRAFMAFTSHTGRPHAAETFYSEINTAPSILKTASVVATTLVADILLIHRTLIVWGRRWWVVVLPVLLYCLDIVASIWFTWSLTQANDNSVLETAAFERSKYFFAASLAVNLVCTCLIAYRIWRVQNAAAGYTGVHHRLRNVLSIVLESAAIYTADLVCMIVFSCMRSGALFIFLNPMPPLVGLVFTFVILKSSSEGDCKRDETHFELRYNNAPRSTVSSERISIKPTKPCFEGVQVHFESVVHRDAEQEQKSIPYKECPA